MPLPAILAIGAGLASLIGGIAKASAVGKASKLAKKEREAKDSYNQKLFEQQEKERKEDAKAKRKAALQRAMGLDSVVAPKYIPGIAPYKSLSDPSIDRAIMLGDVLGGVSQGLSAASSSKFAENPSSYFKSRRGITPGVSMLYDRNKQVPYA